MRRRPPDAGGWAGAVPVEEGEAVGVRTCLQGRALTGTLAGWMWLYVSFTAPLRGGRDHSHFRIKATEAENLGVSLPARPERWQLSAAL